MHLGIIPDGNRRWAREQGLTRRQGHLKGAEVLVSVLIHAVKRGVEEISVYSLSTENLEKRSPEELRDIFEIEAEYFDRLSRDPTVHGEQVRARVLGFTERLPTNMLDAIHRMEEATKDYATHFINFLVPYGGQEELIQATKRLLFPPHGPLVAPNPKEVLEENLFVRTPVDLVIRTADRRLSNFLLYQSAYAEFIFLDKYWPSFTVNDLDDCLEEYEKRVRRRGR